MTADREVRVAGVGMTPFGKQPGRSLKGLAAEATLAALIDAGVDATDLDAAYVGNAIAGLITGQEMVRGPVVLRPAGVQRIPVVTVENACASASTALHLAWQGIRSGAYDVVLALGVEQMVHPDKQVTFDAGRMMESIEGNVADDPAGARAAYVAAIPMRRYGDPAEIAQTMAWLLTEAPPYLTGQTIVVDGGFLIA